MAVHIRAGESQYAHERRAQDQLAGFLSDEWLLISNPPSNRTGAEIDTLIVGPRGAIVVELKDWPDGTTARDSGQWLVDGKAAEYRKGGRRPNPVQQANTAARDFGKFFRKETGARCRFDAVTLAGPPGVELVYEHDIVKEIARPLNEATELVECRVERGIQSEKLGCTPVRKTDIHKLLKWFGVEDLPEVQGWLGATVEEAGVRTDVSVSSKANDSSAPKPSPTPRKSRPENRIEFSAPGRTEGQAESAPNQVVGATDSPAQEPANPEDLSAPDQAEIRKDYESERADSPPEPPASEGAENPIASHAPRVRAKKRRGSVTVMAKRPTLWGSDDPGVGQTPTEANGHHLNETGQRPDDSDSSDARVEPDLEPTVPARKRQRTATVIVKKPTVWGGDDPSIGQTPTETAGENLKPTGKGPSASDSDETGDEPDLGSGSDRSWMQRAIRVLPGIPPFLIALCALAAAMGWIGQEPYVKLDTAPPSVIALVTSDQLFDNICRANDLISSQCDASRACNPNEPVLGIRTVRLLLEGSC